MPQPPLRAAKRQRSARPLADLVLPCIDPVLARQGFGEADVLMHWPEIVGPRLAGQCQPLKLQWRSRGSKPDPEGRIEPATLIVRVQGAFAIELQHMAPTVIERVNGYLGWRCVGKLALRQGPLPPVTPRHRPLPAVDPAAQARATAAAETIADEALRAALVRLGSRVLAGRSPGR